MAPETQRARDRIIGGQVVEVDPTADRRWDAFVSGSVDGEFYHLSAWQEVLRQTYDFAPHCLAVEDDVGHLQGVLPLVLTSSPLAGRKLLSLPFSDVAGPVAASPTAARQLLRYAVDLAPKIRARCVQVRSARNDLAAAEPRLAPDARYVNHVLRLGHGSFAVADNPALAGIRGRVRHTRREGVEIRAGDGTGDLRAFYDLHQKTTKQHGMPAQSFAFFQNLWRILSSSGQIRLFVAAVGSKIIGGSLFALFGERVYYAYNASDPATRRLQSSYPILWHALEWAEREGYRSFSLGKTSRDNPGLTQFKRHWGGDEIPLYSYYFPRVDGLTSSAFSENQVRHQIVTRLWRALPAPLTNVAGGLMYRHLA